MLSRLDELKDYMYYFQFTINPYDTVLEQQVPGKKHVIETFKRLSDLISPDRVIWRYDPIILTDTISVDYHIKYFEQLAKRLHTYTKTCVISFLDLYKKTEKNLRGTYSREPSVDEIINISAHISMVASHYGIRIQTCAEKIELESVGITHGHCIDSVLIEDLLGVKLVVSKDKNQRPECGCVQSIDIGEYNTCAHNCKYCYANFNKEKVSLRVMQHNPKSPLLIGEIGVDDKVTERKIFSFISKDVLF